jgi:hypothetical protein
VGRLLNPEKAGIRRRKIGKAPGGDARNRRGRSRRGHSKGSVLPVRLPLTPGTGRECAAPHRNTLCPPECFGGRQV